MGDPLFTVPIYDRNGTTPDTDGDNPSLCYEIHGNASETFNLVSDECTSVNALYSSMDNPDRGNIISSVGVKAVNNLRQCVNIAVSIESGCHPEIGGTFMDRYNFAGISVRRFGQKVKISVPNCENTELVMWVLCENITDQNENIIGQEMIRFLISRGVNLRPTSHGLLGKSY